VRDGRSGSVICVKGRTITTTSTAPEHITFNPDGSVTVAVTGLQCHLVGVGGPPLASDVGRLVFFFSGPDDEEPDLLFEAGKHNFGPFPSSATYWLILKSGNENARGAASIDEPPLQDWKFGHRDDRHCSQRACG
jgi:hypothetical protein